MKKIILIILCLASFRSFSQDSTKLKQYLGVLRLVEKYRDDKSWTDNDSKIVGEHFRRLVKAKDDGIVVLAGRTQYESSNPDMMGLVIFYAKDDESAKQFMQEDPAVKNNIMLVKVHPYGIAVSKCK